jgi:hypothetical protein
VSTYSVHHSSQILEFEGMFNFSIKLFYKAKEIILSKKRRNQLIDVVLSNCAKRFL